MIVTLQGITFEFHVQEYVKNYHNTNVYIIQDSM